MLPIGPGVFGQALLEKALQFGGDVMVMDTYAYTLLRGALFGGVTHHMLIHADLPPLVQH